jgi:hypothetical protein
MKKIFFSVTGILFVFFSAIFFLPLSASADGMAYDPYSDTWDLMAEKSQQAIINYSQGVEKMVLSVEMGNTDKSFVWLFPVPADAAQVKADVSDSMPNFSGQSMTDRANVNLKSFKIFAWITQIYPMPPMLVFSSKINNWLYPDYPAPGLGGSSANISLGPSAPQVVQDVIVYQHLEKVGMVSEVLSAKTADGLKKYFSDKGLQLKSEALPVLNNYIGKGFSFVASWSQPGSGSSATTVDTTPASFLMPGQEEANKKNNSAPTFSRGVSVSFPTKIIYFPLILTSIYGQAVVPAEIRVIGKVRPDTYREIKPFVKTEYYDRSEFWPSTEANKGFFSDFFGELDWGFDYTKVTINAPANLFKQDLWFKNGPALSYYPVRIFSGWGDSPAYMGNDLFSGGAWVGLIVLIVVCSVVASLLAGLIFLKSLRKDPLKLILIGLTNLLTILGPIIFVALINVKKHISSVPTLENPELKKYKKKRRWAFIIYSICPIFILPAALFVILIPIALIADGYDLAKPSCIDCPGYLNDWPFITSLVFLIAYIFISIIFRKISRIKPEDKALFVELKKEGYSTWTFRPRQALPKFLFLAAFSLLFCLFVFIFRI